MHVSHPSSSVTRLFGNIQLPSVSHSTLFLHWSSSLTVWWISDSCYIVKTPPVFLSSKGIKTQTTADASLFDSTIAASSVNFTDFVCGFIGWSLIRCGFAELYTCFRLLCRLIYQFSVCIGIMIPFSMVLYVCWDLWFEGFWFSRFFNIYGFCFWVFVGCPVGVRYWVLIGCFTMNVFFSSISFWR